MSGDRSSSSTNDVKKTPWKRWADLRLLRWSLALVLVALASVGFAWQWWDPVCSEELASTGPTAVVEVCRSPSITDPALVAGLLVLVLLMWPDLSELSFGIVRLTRQVDESQRRTEAALTDLKQYVALSIRQTVKTEINWAGRGDLTPPQVEVAAAEAIESVAELGDLGDLEMRADSEPPLKERLDKASDPDTDPVAGFLSQWVIIEGVIDWEGELSSKWQPGTGLSQLLGFPPLLGFNFESGDEVETAYYMVQDQFRRHRVTLDAARSARNLIVHNQTMIDDETLRSITRSLYALEGAIRRHMPDSRLEWR
jgi:hypothetical protein